jgi:hypothetical protein
MWQPVSEALSGNLVDEDCRTGTHMTGGDASEHCLAGQLDVGHGLQSD